jgi:iron(III) transport system ATP-binding protein
MVFQSYALWPHMTVADNVAFGLEVRRTDAARRRKLVAQALATVELAELADRKPNELSGGQQQRVALARALVVEPKCLLLDEPLSNLDAGLRVAMRAEIRTICKAAGLTALYVTHDQHEALSTADRIAVMRDGRVEQVAEPRELYDRPVNRFVAAFMGESNFLDGTVTAMDGDAVRVRTAIGELVSSAAPSGLAVGASVICSLRPEAVRLAPAQSRPNVLDGVLAETVFLGETTRYRMKVAGRMVHVLEVGSRGVDRSLGHGIRGWVDPRDVVVLTA